MRIAGAGNLPSKLSFSEYEFETGRDLADSAGQVGKQAMQYMLAHIGRYLRRTITTIHGSGCVGHWFEKDVCYASTEHNLILRNC